MNFKLLFASASLATLSLGMSAHAENVGIGVLEPQAVLHVKGETGSADDVIFQNLNAYDGTADTENILILDEDDGQRVKTIPLIDLLADDSFVNSDFSFDDSTNTLSLTEGGVTLSVDLSSLSDSFTDENTTVVAFDYDASTNILSIVDSDFTEFDVDLSELHDSFTDTTIEPWFGVDDGAAATLNTEDMYTMGEVGIGETSPNAPLHILSGQARAVQINRDGANGQLELRVDNNSNTRIVSRQGILHLKNGDDNTVCSVKNRWLSCITDADDDGNDDNGETPATDLTIENVSAVLDADNVLTITDDAGDITVDLAGIDTNTPLGTHDQVVTATRSVDLATNDVDLSFDGTEQTVLVDQTGRLAVNSNNPSHAVEVGGDIFLTSENSVMFEVEDRGHGINNINSALGGANTNDLEIASRENLMLTFDSNATASDSGDVGVAFIQNDIVSGSFVEVARMTGEGLGIGVTNANSPLDIMSSQAKAIDIQREGATGRLELRVDNNENTRIVSREGILHLKNGGDNTVCSVKDRWLSCITDSDDDGVDDNGENPATDLTIENTAATLSNANILTITDDAGDVSVDLSSLADTDTNTPLGTDDQIVTQNRLIDLATNDKKLTVQGTDIAVTFDNSGNLGINQSNPSQALEVAGNVAIESNSSLFFDTETGNHGINDFDEDGNNELELISKQNLYLTFDSNNNNESAVGVIFQHNDSAATAKQEIARVNGRGLGIGTSPSVKLHVIGDDASDNDVIFENIDAYDGTANNEEVLLVDPSDGSRVKTVPILELISGSISDTTVSNTGAVLAADTNILTITDETGDVTVDLSGLSDTDTTISNTAAVLAADTNILTITDETGDITVDLSGLSDTDTDTTDLDWAVANTAGDLAAAITDNIYTTGNVGINTDDPLYPLVVDTASTSNALVVREASEDGGTFGRVGVGTDTPGYSLDVNGDIRATGNIYSGDQFLASNFFQTSDRRLKTDVEGYNKGLEVLRQMRTVSFRYNGMGLPSNTERLHYGVIAQELEEIDAELVGSFTSPEDGIDYKTVNVQSMTYVLANAVQQLDRQNSVLMVMLEAEQEARKLEAARMAELERTVMAMKAQLGL